MYKNYDLIAHIYIKIDSKDFSNKKQTIITSLFRLIYLNIVFMIHVC